VCLKQESRLLRLVPLFWLRVLPSPRFWWKDILFPEADVEAIGTTIGGEAGFLLGGFYGALISILVVTSIATWTDIAADSSFTRLLAVGLTLAGGLLGWLSGKQALANQPLAQKKKGNPDIPRSFCVRVNGSPSELKKARGVITQSRIDRSVEQVS